jgi:hypothetical protein
MKVLPKFHSPASSKFGIGYKTSRSCYRRHTRYLRALPILWLWRIDAPCTSSLAGHHPMVQTRQQHCRVFFLANCHVQSFLIDTLPNSPWRILAPALLHAPIAQVSTSWPRYRGSFWPHCLLEKRQCLTMHRTSPDFVESRAPY